MQDKGYMVPAVSRAIMVLEFISHRESATLQEIVDSLALPRTSTYHILRTLAELGYLRQSRSGGYALDMKLFFLGNQAASQVDIRSESIPLMYELMRATQLTVFLGVLVNNEGIYLAKVDGPNSVASLAWVGKRFALHSTSLGKALLAWCDMQEVRTIVAEMPFTQYTENTFTTMEAFSQHLVEVRKRGWAEDAMENVPSVSCIGAPVFGPHGKVVAAISASGQAQSLTAEQRAHHAPVVLAMAQRLSEAMGYKTGYRQ